jgi:hypothetical protein
MSEMMTTFMDGFHSAGPSLLATFGVNNADSSTGQQERTRFAEAISRSVVELLPGTSLRDQNPSSGVIICPGIRRNSG